MGRIVGACLVWLLVILPAHAGPWPREAGDAFFSLSAERDRDGNTYTGLYTEYGLTRRRTIGLEIGHTDVGETSALLWYQKSLDRGDGPNRLAYSIGLGATERDGELSPLGQAALMWGRGFARPWDGGWITAEGRVKVSGRTEEITVRDGLTSVQYSYLTPDTVAKLDLTLGVRRNAFWAFVNQLRLEARKDEDFSAKLASSAVYDIPGPARIEAGIIMPLTGPGEPAIRIATWLEF